MLKRKEYFAEIVCQSLNDKIDFILYKKITLFILRLLQLQELGKGIN